MILILFLTEETVLNIFNYAEITVLSKVAIQKHTVLIKYIAVIYNSALYF
jgi:hypothetical protein